MNPWPTLLGVSAAKTYSLLAGLFTLFITARWLGPEGRGAFVVVTSWVGVAALMLNLSLGQYSIYRSERNKGPIEDWLNEVLSVMALYVPLATILGWITFGFLAISPWNPFGQIDSRLLCIGFVFLPFFIISYYTDTIFSAIGQLPLFNYWLVIVRTVTAAALFFLVAWLEGGVTAVVWVAMFGTAAPVLIAIRYLYRRQIFSWPETSTFISYLKGAPNLHIGAIATYAFASLDILILNRYSGEREVGYYQLGVQILSIGLIVPYTAATMIYGKIANTGLDKIWPDHRRLIFQVLFLISVGSVGVWFLAPYWLVWLAGDQFLPTLDVLGFQLISLMGIAFGALIAPQWIARGHLKMVSTIAVFLGIGSVIANMALIPTHGMVGAAWVSLGTYTAVFLISLGMFIYCEYEHQKSTRGR